jgi:invasion protein IalB
MAQLGLKGALRPVFAAAVLLLPAAAMAQDAAAPASQPSVDTVKPSPGEAWVKVCAPDPTTNKQLCQVIQQIAADTGQFIASVNIKTLEGESKMLFAAAMRMPTTGVLVGPGMRAQIDGGKQYEVKYSICYPDVCYADMQVDDAFIGALKAGGQLTLIALTQQGADAKPIGIPMTLVGFTKAYDGKGIDPAAAQAQRDDLAKSLKAHADEARQKLLEQQKAAGGQ